MDKDDLARVLCRIVGLYFVLTAILGAGQLVLMLVMPMASGANSFTTSLLTQMIVPHLLHLLVGVIVWKNAPAIGVKVAQ